jgi:hypothetical protein
VVLIKGICGDLSRAPRRGDVINLLPLQLHSPWSAEYDSCSSPGMLVFSVGLVYVAKIVAA